MERKGLDYDQSAYRDHVNYKRTARNKVEDLLYISKGDPYRLERSQSIYATGDLRMFFMAIAGSR